MIRKIIAVSMVVFPMTACTAETISVYQFDGSVHCREAETTTPAEAREMLKQAGVDVISSESRMVPFKVSDACGTPTGRANVLIVDADDWNRMLRSTPGAHGFGVWVFDRTEVEVYRYDGSLQCERGTEVSLEDMARELTQKGIEVIASRKGSDGRMRIAMCGASTGQLNVYTIAMKDLAAARELGFELLVTRQMTNEIGGSAKRLGPAISPTPPPAAGTAQGQAIPKLW